MQDLVVAAIQAAATAAADQPLQRRGQLAQQPLPRGRLRLRLRLLPHFASLGELEAQLRRARVALGADGARQVPEHTRVIQVELLARVVGEHPEHGVLREVFRTARRSR